MYMYVCMNESMDEILLSRYKAIGQFWPMRQNAKYCNNKISRMGAAVLYVSEAVLLLMYREVFWISIESLQRSRIMQFKLILI